MSDWQPIETAPIGKALILYFPEERDTWGERTHSPWIKVNVYPVPYWRQPTHWMPLPEPPEAAS